MVDPKVLQSDIDTVLRLIERQFGFKAKNLRKAMRRIGRRVPKSAHRHASVLLAAQQKATHPKLAVQVDDGSVKAAMRGLSAAVQAYDRKKAREDRFWDILGSMVINLTVLAMLIAAAVYLQSLT